MRRLTAFAFVALWTAMTASTLRGQVQDDNAPPPVPRNRSLFQVPPGETASTTRAIAAGAESAAGVPEAPAQPALLSQQPTETAPAQPLVSAAAPGVTLVVGGVDEVSNFSTPPEVESGWLEGWGLHPFMETGVNVVRPVFQRGAAVIVSRPPNGSGAPAGFASSSFGYDLGVAPRITIGIANDDGWGLQMSWWSFDQLSTPLGVQNVGTAAGVQVASIPLQGIPGITSPSPAGRAFGVANDVMTFSSQVKLSAWDFEGTHEMALWGWQMRGTLGMRYGYVSQGYGATRANAGAGFSGPAAINLAADNELIQAGHNFSGLGPTTAIILRHPIANTNVSFFLSDRISALFGDSNTRDFQLTQLAGTSTLPGGASTPFSTVTSVGSATTQSICVPAEDFEAGVEWERTVGRSRAFLRAAVVDQEWFDAGSPTQTHGNLMLIGVSVTAGIAF